MRTPCQVVHNRPNWLIRCGGNPSKIAIEEA